jgi:acyl carrier protein
VDSISTAQALKSFIVGELLDGQGEDLSEDTQLLSTGIVNSMSIVRICNFIGERFNVEIPPEKMTPGNFSTITAIAALVQECVPQ